MQMKRPDKVVHYKPAHYEEDAGGDFLQLLSFVFVFIGIFLKYKIALWMSLFLFMSSFANLRHKSDYKQIIITGGMIMMGFVTLYLIPHPNRSA